MSAFMQFRNAKCFAPVLLAISICSFAGVMPSSSLGQETPSSQPASSVVLPESTDAFRQIFFYQSQVAELVPPTFRPIDLSELEERLKDRPNVSKGGSVSPLDNPQLIRSVYIAKLDKDRLISKQSFWDIACRDENQARLIVGKLGLAVRVNSSDMSGSEGTQVVGDLQGNASVVVNGDSRVTFGWSSLGKPIDRGFLFDLVIPASVQTRFLIESPRDMEVQAIDGVGRTLPSPPPEAGLSSTSDILETPTTWYSIDAGGLTRVRLRLRSKQNAGVETTLPVRQASIQYDLSPQSIRFVTRMLVDARTDTVLPVLSFEEGLITSVRVGGTTVPWSEATVPDGVGIRMDLSRLDPASASGTMNITVEGQAAWNPGGGSQSLPWPRWRDCRPILIATEMQAQIRLDASLNALRFQLPSRWRFAPSTVEENGSQLYRCVGVLGNEGPAVLVRPDEKQSTAESVLKLTATNTKFVAQYDTSVLMNPIGPQPVQLRIDRGWSADLVTVTSSGRIIDIQNDPKARQNITIWPTSDELVGRNLQIRIVGSMPIRSVAGRIEFPATSFASIQNSRNQVAAMITPPLGFNWTGDAALRTTRITQGDLTSTQRSMLGDLSGDSLLVDLPEGRLSPLVCKRPDVSLDTTSRLALRREGDRLIETLLIACDSTSADIQSIVVDLGALSDRPPMQWSTVHVDGSNRRIESITRMRPADLVIPTADQIEISDQNTAIPSGPAASVSGKSPIPSIDPNESEIWQIAIGNRAERQVMFHGRREYPFRGDRSIPLPVVPGASSKSSEVIVMPTLDIKQIKGPAVLVPPVPMLMGSVQPFGTASAETDPVPGAVVLRYDATEKSAIVLGSMDKADNTPVLWREDVRIVASNRGGDVVVATYDVDPGIAFDVKHDINLRLVSVTDSLGAPIAYESTPTNVKVVPGPSTTRIAITWNRIVFSNSIARTWVAPRLNAIALILHRDWQLVPAVDTVIPLVQFFGQSETASIAIAPETQRVWIFDSAIAFPATAIIGLLTFAFNWWLAGRNPHIALLVWTVSTVPILLLFSNSLLWIACISVPLAAGGLIALTVSPERGIRRKSTRSSVPRKPTILTDSVRRQNETRSSLDRYNTLREGVSSWSGRVPAWLLLTSLSALVALSPRDAVSQTASRPMTATPLDRETATSNSTTSSEGSGGSMPLVLIPTTADGKIAGSKVYVPQSSYVDLFRNGLPSTVPIQIRSASYRLRLGGAAESKAIAELEVRLQLEDTTQRIDVSLPFQAAQVKSLQWLTDLDSRPLRWNADLDGAMKCTLPPASNASLFIRVAIDVESTSPFALRLRFRVPPFAGATLLVDAGTVLQSIDIAKSFGEVDAQPDAGRLSVSLGAISEIDVVLTYRDPLRSVATITERRYWVHSGYDRTNIECEIDLDESSIRKGSEVPIVLIEGQAPLVMSPNWTILATEPLSVNRQQLTLQAKQDNPGSIRFLWELDSLAAPPSTAGTSVPIVIPEIQSLVVTSTAPRTTIALDAAQGLRLIPQSTASPADSVVAPLTSPINLEAVDSFVSSWKGYRGIATEVLTATTPLPRLLITAAEPKAWEADEVQHLHVRPGELQLSYSATITPGDRLIGPLRVALPVGSELRVLTMNGISIDTVPRRVGNRDEVAITAPTGSDAIRLRVVLHSRVSQTGRFNPPRISLEPIQVTKGTYSLSRDQSLLVEEVVSGGLIETEASPMGPDDQLVGGWIPCWTWRLDEVRLQTSEDPNRRSQLPGVFRIESRDITIESQQRTSLIWNQNRWDFETLLRLRPVSGGTDKQSPGRESIDFLNVELPTIWCNNLSVEPDMAWSRQPSIETATQILRIRPSPLNANKGLYTIRIRGERSVSADSRIEVPLVRILGSGRRDIYLSVPKTLDGRSLDWDTSAVVGSAAPDELISHRSVSDQGLDAAHRDVRHENELTFRAVAGNASVRLAPSRFEASEPQATMADVQWFATQGRKSIVFCRWDISPGRDESVRIILPQSASMTGVWIDDQPMRYELGEAEVTVSLPLSRLAQSVVLVCEVDQGVRSPSSQVPKLKNIPVDESWLTVYEAKGNSSRAKASVSLPKNWTTSTEYDRHMAIGASICKATELSLVRVTERSQDQIVKWIEPWDRRFRELSAQSSSEIDTLLKDQASTQDSEKETFSWSEQERKWRQYVLRVAGETTEGESVNASRWTPPADWRVVTVARHAGEFEVTPTIRVTERSSAMVVVIQLLMLMSISAGLCLILWLGRRWTLFFATHPAIWLFATGLSSLAVAPVPVAIATCLVAVLIPVLNHLQSPSHRRI